MVIFKQGPRYAFVSLVLAALSGRAPTFKALRTDRAFVSDSKLRRRLVDGRYIMQRPRLPPPFRSRLFQRGVAKISLSPQDTKVTLGGTARRLCKKEVTLRKKGPP